MGIWNGIELQSLTLTGDRLTIRPWRPADAQQVYEGAQDPMMKEFLPIPDPYTRADADAFVTVIGPGDPISGIGISGAVIETATGRVVGGANLRLPHAGRAHAEIGYSIYPWGRGHGYAAETARTYARWAFEHQVGRIEIRCSVRNLASAKSAMAAGFRFESIQRDAAPATSAGVDDDALFSRLAADPETPVPPMLAPLPAGGLSDGVLALRVNQPGDAEALFDEHSDPVSRSWGFDDKPADPAYQATVAARAGLEWLVGPVGRLAMIEVASGDVAGSMQLRPGPPGVLELGYGVRPAYRGHRYTTHALRLVMGWAFEHAAIGRLELGAKVANVASQRAAQHAGFVPDGIMAARLRNPDGTFSDEARFAAVRPTGLS
jgi:RimJ/RimL family protein N-acetyltransferase